MFPDMIVVYLTVLAVVAWVGGVLLARRSKGGVGREDTGDPPGSECPRERGLPPFTRGVDHGTPDPSAFHPHERWENWWDDLDFPYARVLRELPEGETLTVDVGPLDPGEYAFFSGQGSMRGTLVVRADDAG